MPQSEKATYRVWLKPDVHKGREQLPGHIRQRVKRAIHNLGTEPRPSKSRILRLTGEFHNEPEWELRRIRLESWRIVYAINANWQEVAILSIRQRPPYNYEDLESLLSDLIKFD